MSEKKTGTEFLDTLEKDEIMRVLRFLGEENFLDLLQYVDENVCAQILNPETVKINETELREQMLHISSVSELETLSLENRINLLRRLNKTATLENIRNLLADIVEQQQKPNQDIVKDKFDSAVELLAVSVAVAKQREYLPGALWSLLEKNITDFRISDDPSKIAFKDTADKVDTSISDLKDQLHENMKNARTSLIIKNLQNFAGSISRDQDVSLRNSDATVFDRGIVGPDTKQALARIKEAPKYQSMM